VGFNGLDTLRTWVDALATDSPLRTELGTMDVYFTGSTTGTSRPIFFGQRSG